PASPGQRSRETSNPIPPPGSCRRWPVQSGCLYPRPAPHASIGTRHLTRTARRRAAYPQETAMGEQALASENVLDVMVHRHVFDTERPFTQVLDGIFSGISQPDMAQLFGELAAS